MEYLKTHPWINFEISFPSHAESWLRLGEIASKCEHLAGVPLRPDVAAHLHSVFLAKGALATTAIEGNTLSETQVMDLMKGKLELPPSQHYLQQEVQNVLDAINQEVHRHRSLPEAERPKLCSNLIKDYNRQILKDLPLEEGTVPGQFRYHSVVVGNIYRGAPAADCDYLIDRLCDWLNSSDFQPPTPDFRIPYALIKAIVAHVYLAWIHPFGDGNGRTARLVEFHLLYASGIPLPAAHLLSDHYNATRSAYYRELAVTSQGGIPFSHGQNLYPFMRYALQGFLDGLRGQIQRIRDQQLEVAWENYVHDLFRHMKSSQTQKRRRDLTFFLSKDKADWVDVTAIETNSPFSREYEQAGDRMMQRDLNALHGMGLIQRRYGKVKAAKERIRAFLPDVVPPKPARKTSE